MLAELILIGGAMFGLGAAIGAGGVAWAVAITERRSDARTIDPNLPKPSEVANAIVQAKTAALTGEMLRLTDERDREKARKERYWKELKRRRAAAREADDA